MWWLALPAYSPGPSFPRPFSNSNRALADGVETEGLCTDSSGRVWEMRSNDDVLRAAGTLGSVVTGEMAI